MRRRLLFATVLVGLAVVSLDAQLPSRFRLSSVVVPTTTMVPDVVNLSQAAATTAITSASLILGSVTPSSSPTVPSGFVISSSPSAGATVALGSAVNIVVSTGVGTITACTRHTTGNACIWLDDATLAVVNAKEAALDAQWVSVKNYADLLSANENAIPQFTITDVSKAAAAVFTVTEGVPWPSGDAQINIGGGTGEWATLNHVSIDTPVNDYVIATRLTATTFSVPINTSGISASFSGQLIAIFPYSYSRYGEFGGTWKADLFNLGVVYQATGTVRYCDLARKELRYIASLGVAGITAPAGDDDSFSIRNYMQGVAFAYDFCFAHLTTQEKADTITAGNLWYDHVRAYGAEINSTFPGNYMGGYLVGLGLFGIATAGENARAGEINAYFRAKWDAISTRFASGGELEGGQVPEGTIYGFNNWTSIMQYLTAIRTSTGEDIASTSPAPAALAKNLIYQFRPDRIRGQDESDSSNCTNIVNPAFPIQLISVLPGHVEAGWMQHLLAIMQPSLYTDCAQANPFHVSLLWYNAAGTDTDYTATEPYVKYLPGSKHTFWRSGWGTSDIFMSMKGTTEHPIEMGHGHRLAGHINVQRGADYMLVDSNAWKGTTGVSGAPGTGNHGATVGMNEYGNTLFHEDGARYCYGAPQYAGCQAHWGTDSDAYTKHQENTTAGWAYQKAQLYQAYCNGDSCSGYAPTRTLPAGSSLMFYERSVVMQGTGVMVVYDNAVSSDDIQDNRVTWHISTEATTSTAGGYVTATQGASRMFIKPLAATGFASKLVESRDQSQALANTTFRETVTDVLHEGIRPGPAGPPEDFRAMTVICVGASSMTVCPTTFIASSGDTMYGAQVTDTASTIHVNLFSASGACQTSATFTVTGTGTTQQKIGDLCPLVQYYVAQGGTRRFTRVASSQGVIAFDAAIVTSDTFAITTATDEMAGGYFASDNNVRYSGMITPLPGETFVAPADLRLIGARFDASGIGGVNPVHVDFYANDTLIATVAQGSAGQEDRIYKTRYSSLAAGSYKIWTRGYYLDGTWSDSPTHAITVIAAPTYSETINLVADLDISGLTYSKIGNPSGHIKFVGNGHRLIGTPTSFTCIYCDFFDMGDRDATADTGILLTLSGTGNFTLTNSRFENVDITQIAMNSSGTMTVENNVWASNTRQPLGQNAFQTGQAQGSYWVLKFTGSGAGVKTFRGNNVGAGWVDMDSPGWVIGGATSNLGNVMMGPRVGFWLRSNFTSTVWSHNFSHHMYLGGWSEGSVYELGSLTGAGVIEHNVVSGGSWPVRFLSSEFRYNLVTGGGGVEGTLWSGTAAPNVHHNILWGPSQGRHAFHQEHGAVGTLFRNNTIDVVNDLTSGSAGEGNIGWISGTGTMNSNMVLNTPAPAVTITSSTVTTDYNAYYSLASPFTHYSDGRGTPANEVSGDTNPGMTMNTDVNRSTPWSYAAVWTRTQTVSQILAEWRTWYTPTTGVIDTGDTGTYGAGNDRGAVGAGTANAFDLFGTTTP